VYYVNVKTQDRDVKTRKYALAWNIRRQHLVLCQRIHPLYNVFWDKNYLAFFFE